MGKIFSSCIGKTHTYQFIIYAQDYYMLCDEIDDKLINILKKSYDEDLLRSPESPRKGAPKEWGGESERIEVKEYKWKWRLPNTTNEDLSWSELHTNIHKFFNDLLSHPCTHVCDGEKIGIVEGVNLYYMCSDDLAQSYMNVCTTRELTTQELIMIRKFINSCEYRKSIINSTLCSL